MEQVLCNTGSLCLPVKPQTTGAVVDMVAAENNIDSSMHFDTANLCSCQILLVINVVDMVVFNNREYASKMSYNTCLTAVMDLTSAHNMGTDVFFIPILHRKPGRCSRVLSEFRLCISTLTICYHFQAADIYQEKYRCIWIHRFHSLR